VLFLTLLRAAFWTFKHHKKVGVEYDTRRGVQVDDCFQTTNPRIYACGDVASPFKFTHAADWQVTVV
jgi:pyruvate/2-oxoglutarate dehydrogenase complex dihydrolipoamide dehydrogenase (E3) component